jgi:DNA-binding IclR family transcriptional regulator
VAWLSKEELETLLIDYCFTAYTPATITFRRSLRKTLALTREQVTRLITKKMNRASAARQSYLEP